MNGAALANQLRLLPNYLANHLLLTLVALAFGVAISAPLTLIALRWPSARGPLLAGVSVVQTIPSLALLALMVTLLGVFGREPAIIALTLYSVLPILRNAVTGIESVDPAAVEAARALGMTRSQTLLRVQLPLASPVIIAGLRTATVWVVGIATLSTPVGATSLGNYIFSGLQTRNYTAVLVGVVAAAGLALVLDGLIRLAEIAARRRSPRLGAVAGAALLTVCVGGLAPLVIPRRVAGEPVVVGAKTFTEQYILSRLIADRLVAAGVPVDRRSSLGSTVAFDALVSGRVGVYVDYTGTIWANQMKRTDAPPGAETLNAVAEWLRDDRGVTCLGPLGFENAYCLAMRRDRADALGVRTIEDLARVAPTLDVGGDYEFFGRPEWNAVRDVYGLRFREQRGFDSSLMYAAVEQGEVDVISAFSTDGRIAAFDLLVLGDPRHAFPPYDAVLLLSSGATERPEVVEALRPLVGSIDDRAMRTANRMVDVDKETVRDAAAWLDAAATAPAPPSATGSPGGP